MKKIFRWWIFLLSCFISNVFANPCLEAMSQRISMEDGQWFLNLNACHLQDSDIPTILTFLTQYTYITGLNLWDNQISDQGASELANTKLATLDLTDNNVGAEGALALAHHSILTMLYLSNNHVGDEGAIGLAGSTTLIGLFLTNNQISPVGAAALLGNNKTLLWLDLRNNHIGKEHAGMSAAHTLTYYAANKTLQALAIGNNDLHDEDALLLATNSNVLMLEAGQNYFTREGIAALAKNKTITWLILPYSQIDDVMAVDLAKNTSLIGLDVSHNMIGDTGAIALAKNVPIDVLDVSYNHINTSGLNALLATQKKVDIEGNEEFTHALRPFAHSHIFEKQKVWRLMDKNRKHQMY